MIDPIAALFSGLVGYSVKWALDRGIQVFVKQRSLRRAWDFLSEPTHVFLPLANITSVGASGGYGDLLALSRVITMANAHFAPASNLFIHPDQSEFKSVRQENIVIIGGGKHNAVFREMIDAINPPLHFFDTDKESFVEIRNHDRSIIYAPVYDAAGLVATDLGMLIRARNPFNNRKYALIAAGSHTYGSVAAIDYFLHASYIREISKHLSQNIEVIVRASVNQHSVSHISRISPIVTW